MPRYKTNTRIWNTGKRNKNNELIGTILGVGISLSGLWALLSKQSRELIIILAALLIGTLSIGATGFATLKAYRKSQTQRALSIVNIDAMSGREFEWYVAELLRHQGYSRVEVTKTSGDYGADIIAHKGREKWAVQAKCYSKPVGNKAVNEVVGSKNYYRCDRTMVVTNSRFTPNAKMAALANNTTLVDRDKLASWILTFQRGIPTSRA